MPNLDTHLDLERCPHCGIDRPSMSMLLGQFSTKDYRGVNERFWTCYRCARCGGVVLAMAAGNKYPIDAMYPGAKTVDESISSKARSYLFQAISTQNSPSAAVMVTASAIDAMLKGKGLTKGSLYVRIEQAAADHLITSEMAQWAHEIRLEANDERHADEDAALPTSQDAARCLEFALALGEFLFVLPSRVTRGLSAAKVPAKP